MAVISQPAPRPLVARTALAPGRLIVWMVAAVLFAVGWSASTVVLAVVWCGAAVRVGWDDARRVRGTR